MIVFALPTICERPRYGTLSRFPDTLQRVLILLLIINDALPLKLIKVLFLFICWPKTCSYTFKISIIALFLVMFALKNNTLSSTNRMWVMLGVATLHILTSIRSCVFITCCGREIKPFVQRRNRHGERGSPIF